MTDQKEESKIKEQKAEALRALSEFGGGESEPFQALTKERLVGELFTEQNRERKTRIPNVFNHTLLNMLALFLSNPAERAKLLGEKSIKGTPTLGDLTRGFIKFYENSAYAHQGLARAEYITALNGVGDSEDDKLKKQRALESIIGV
jgi:hypothetical protein